MTTNIVNQKGEKKRITLRTILLILLILLPIIIVFVWPGAPQNAKSRSEWLIVNGKNLVGVYLLEWIVVNCIKIFLMWLNEGLGKKSPKFLKNYFAEESEDAEDNSAFYITDGVNSLKQDLPNDDPEVQQAFDALTKVLKEKGLYLES